MGKQSSKFQFNNHQNSSLCELLLSPSFLERIEFDTEDFPVCIGVCSGKHGLFCVVERYLPNMLGFFESKILSVGSSTVLNEDGKHILTSRNKKS